MICLIILIVILFSFIFFCHSIRFSQMGRGSISIKSHISFLMSTNFAIIDYMGQFAKSVSFSRLALLEFEYDSSDMMEVIINKVFDGVIGKSISWEFLAMGNLYFE